MPPVAVPASGTVTDPPLMVGTLSVAACAPPPDGWNVTSAVVDEPGSNVVDAGVPTLKLPGFVPSMKRLARLTLTVASGLVIVTVAGTVPPTTTEPKLMLAGDTKTGRFCGSLGVRIWKSALLLPVSCRPPLTRSAFRS